MSDHKDQNNKNKQSQNPPTPSQAEGDESTVDKALSNSKQQDNSKKQQ